MKASQLQKTINYASFFNASLTLEGLHFWLISPKKHSLVEVRNLLTKHPSLKKKIISTKDKYLLKKTRLTNQKIKTVQKLVNVLKIVPSIKLIALTGSLSVNNPKKRDDIDLMIVVTPNTLWLTRPLVIFLTSTLSIRRKPRGMVTTNTICTNLWLDQLNLTVPKNKQNLYTAHEVLQTKPLFDRGGVHQQFVKKNIWTKKYLATAYNQIAKTSKISPLKVSQPNWLIEKLNLLFFKLQYLYMKPKITKEHITLHSAYFHPRNLYLKIKKHLF